MEEENKEKLLSNVLSKIANRNKELPANNGSNDISNIATSISSWQEYLDPTTGMPYYHDVISGETTWEKPNDIPSSCFVPPPLPPPTSYSVETNTAVSVRQDGTAVVDDYRFVATFNRKTGRFSSTNSLGESEAPTYWDRVGRASDKAGRQIEAFISLEDLEKNRMETKALREQGNPKNVDWRKYKEEKTKEKKRKRNSWMLED